MPTASCRELGAPHDRSPLGGLGGERPQEGGGALSGLAEGVGGRAPSLILLNEFCWLLVTRSSESPLSGKGGCGEPWLFV